MRTRHQQLLSCALLAIYSSIALLGHALHWLSPEDHHHYAKVSQGSHSSHSHHHCGHHDHDCRKTAPADSCGDALLFTAGDCVAHWHACDICDFLDQIKSQHPHVAAAPVSHSLFTSMPRFPQHAYAPVAATLPTARGPPALLTPS